VAEARRRDPGLDTDALTAFVRSGVDAVARAVEPVDAQATPAAVREAFDLALILVAQGLAGPAARHPFVERVWREVAPGCARLLAAQPRAVLGALSNAAAHVAAVPGAQAARWVDEMKRLAPQAADLAQLRVLGQVAAWRSGLPQYRRGALEAADQLPPTLALVAAGGPALPADAPDAPARWLRMQQALLANPWWACDDERLDAQRQWLEVGGFRGLGGPFAEPPRVRAGLDGFIVGSGAGQHHLLLADAFGAVLLPATAQDWEQAGADAAALKREQTATLQGRHLRLGPRSVELDGPAGGLELAQDAHTAVVASPFSHRLRVLAKT
jgi:hypothetical protein